MRSDSSDAMLQQNLERKERRKSLLASALPYISLVLLVIFFSLATQGRFIGSSNLRNLISQGFTMTLVVAGAAFIYACGNMDMSLGAVYGISAIAAGLLMSSFEVSGWVALLAAILSAVCCTSITSIVYSLLGVPPFVASLCMLNICNGLISWIVEDGEIYTTYALYKLWDQTLVHGAVLLIVLVVGYLLFTKTRIGKDARALGGNRMCAVISGVKRARAIWITYAIMGTCIGIAGFFGIVASSRISSGSNTLALNTITAVVLGGFPLRGGAKAKYPAAIVGAILVTILSNGLTLMGLDPAVTLVMKGLLFLVVVAMGADRSSGKLIK